MAEWTQEWPREEGWHWFCDMDGRPPLVEPARVLMCGASVIWARGAEGFNKKDCPNAWWHPMEEPPALPTGEANHG